MAQRTVTTLPVTEKTVGQEWNATTQTGNFDSSRAPIDTIYLHTMVGTAEGADARFNNAQSKVSAHYGITLSGELWHWTDEDKTAYHCGVYKENQRSIGIEHEDNNNPNDAERTDAQYIASAKLVSDICRFYSIPCDRQHIKKHSESGFATACPDGLNVDRIVREAAALLQPEVAPEPQSPPQPEPVAQPTPEIYKGLDLSNVESVKAAIDTWSDVSQGRYLLLSDKAQIAVALGIDEASPLDKIIESIKTLKVAFTQQVKVATGIPVLEQVEGEGPAVVAVKPTIKNAPPEEKNELVEKLRVALSEIELLLGLK